MWLEIFRTGRHTDSSGNTAEFTAEMLDSAAILYNTSVSGDESSRAPIVKGHPADDSPAFGYVERLARRGDKLFAQAQNLSVEIIDDLRTGRFTRISSAFYPDMKLRHVGLLGGAAPAVNGLRIHEFTEFQIEEKQEESEGNGKIMELNARLKQENDKLRRQISEFRAENSFREFESVIGKDSGLNDEQRKSLTDIFKCAADNSDLSGKIRQFAFSFKNPQLTREFDFPKTPDSGFSGKNTTPERLGIHEKALQFREMNPAMTYEEAIQKAIIN